MDQRLVRQGRWTAHVEGEFVVFLIGMRINHLAAVRQWLPVVRAMVPMLRELMADPDSGMLGFRNFVGLRELTQVQYWRSSEQLRSYANDAGREHRPAWLRFFRMAWQSGAVGIWHETYVVPAGSYECVYGNMPPTGLGKATQLIPVGQVGETADERLDRGSAGRGGTREASTATGATA